MNENNNDSVIPPDRLKAFRENQASAMETRKEERGSLTRYKRSLLPPKKTGRR